MLCGCFAVVLFFFSSRRRHTICALVTGVQTCALPISEALRQSLGEDGWDLIKSSEFLNVTLEDAGAAPTAPTGPVLFQGPCINQIGRASCRVRVCQYV